MGFVVAGLTGRSCDPLVKTPVKEPTTWGGGTACRPRENTRRTSAAAPAAAGRQSQPDSNRRSRREATTHAHTCASRWQREGRGGLLLIRNGHDHLFIALRTYLAAPAQQSLYPAAAACCWAFSDVRCFGIACRGGCFLPSSRSCIMPATHTTTTAHIHTWRSATACHIPFSLFGTVFCTASWTWFPADGAAAACC